MKKSVIIGIAFISLITTFTAYAVSNQELLALLSDFKIVVNGTEKSFDKPIVTINDSTYIPLRDVSETLNMDVNWDEATKTISIKNPDILYPFENEDGLWGYKDYLGNIVVTPKYFYGEEFQNGLALVATSPGQNGQYGFIDVNGEMVIPPIYPTAYSFQNGAALVSFADSTHEGRFTYINNQGDLLFETEFSLAKSFSEGYAVVLTDGPSYPSLDMDKQRWSYIDKSGNFATDLVFEEANSFKNGYAIVKNEGKYGVIDNNFTIVIEFEYDNITMLDDRVFCIEKDGKSTDVNLK